MYLLVITLYIFVGYTSYGYDDEFFNVVLIEKLGWGAIQVIQSSDVHPPGSYIIDVLLYKIFGKWEIVRAIIGLNTALSLVYAINVVKNKYGIRSAVISYILLGLNPAILLWCTGLRWYAFFVPILIWLSFPLVKKGSRLWIQCFGGLLLLSYFGYAAFVIAPSIFLIYWNHSNECINVKIKNAVICGVTCLALYSHQIYTFYNIHYKNIDGQTTPLINNLIGFLVAQVSNQGVFPLSIPGLVTAIGTVGILALLIFTMIQCKQKNNYFLPYLSGVLFFILFGLAGKFRNLVILSPFQALLISTYSIKNVSVNKFFNIFLIFISIGNICGIYNVVNHHNTTKNSWNMPVKQVITELSMRRNQCNNDLLVLSYAPDLAWHLKNDNFNIISPFSGEEIGYPIKNNYKCIFVLKTNIGHISRARYNAMFDIFDKARFESSSIQYYGRDDNYLLKRMLDKNYPEYSIELVSYFKVQNLKDLNTWSTPLEYAK